MELLIPIVAVILWNWFARLWLAAMKAVELEENEVLQQNV